MHALEWSVELDRLTGSDHSLAGAGSSLSISYIDRSNPTSTQFIFRGHGSDCRWNSTHEVIDPTHNSGYRSKLLLDPYGTWHVLYLRSFQFPAYEICYSKLGTTGVWQTPTVLGYARSTPLGFAVDASGTLHIAYERQFENGTTSLVYQSKLGSSWSLPTAIFAGDLSGLSLAVNPADGTPFIACVTTAGGLKFSKGPDFSVIPMSVETGFNGSGCAIGLDPTGQLARIAYAADPWVTGDHRLRYFRATSPANDSFVSYESPQGLFAWGEVAMFITPQDLARIAFAKQVGSGPGPMTYLYETSPGVLEGATVLGGTGGTGSIGLVPNANNHAVIAFDNSHASGGIGMIRLAEANPGTPDVIRPARISDLTVHMGKTTAVLSFTATGDDSLTGPASHYDIRQSVLPITNETSFLQATPVLAPCPASPGARECVSVTGLSPCSQYHFAVRVRDNHPDHWSALGSTAFGSTKCSGFEVYGCDEGEGLTSGAGEAAGSIELHVSGESPHRQAVTIRVASASTGPHGEIRFRIMDVAGRVFRTGLMQDSEDAFEWDLRDNQGRSVPSGVYFASATSSIGSATATLVVAR